MLVSIIIPCYNVENYVADALDSALAQTYRPIEIIAVDNNSTDNTLNILKDYESRYPGLITVLQEPKQGAPAARNRGLYHAKGEWLQFLDSDDLLLPSKIERQLTLLKQGKNVSYISGGTVFKDLDGKRALMEPMPDPIKGVMEGLKGGGTSSNLWNRRKILEVEGWKEKLKGGQDIDLMMRLLIKNGRVLISEEPLTIKRERKTGQISKKNPKTHLRTHVFLRGNFLKSLQEKSPSYYLRNKDFLQFALFRYIRMLGGYDSQQAIDLFERFFPNGLKLYRVEDLNIGKKYACIVNLIGYPRTEQLKRLVKKLLINRRLQDVFRSVIHGKSFLLRRNDFHLFRK